MSSLLVDILAVLGALLILIFLSVKTTILSDRNAAGRTAFLSGCSLILAGLVWQIFKSQEGYGEWFLSSAYLPLQIAQTLLLLTGLLLLAKGLVRHEQQREKVRSELDRRERQLSVLSNLQDYARSPFRLLELLDISVKEIVSAYQDSAGAVFMVNRPRRQFVLAASIGLTPDETVSLEHYPMEHNPVSQAVESGDPVLVGEFAMFDDKGKRIHSRFSSAMILPLVSEMESLGGIIIFSTEEGRFDRTDIQSLTPTSNWLAEKIRSVRLGREVIQLKKANTSSNERLSEFMQRLANLSLSMTERNMTDSILRKLAGFADSRSAHLIGIIDGGFQYFGGSESMGELSENYKTALIDSLDRGKPVIINQESKDSNNRSIVTRSTLTVPVTSGGDLFALVLIKDGAALAIDDDQLRFTEILARLAAFSVAAEKTGQLDITRKRGIERIIELLRFERLRSPAEDPEYLFKHLSDILPRDTVGLSFLAADDGFLELRGVLGLDRRDVIDLRLSPGEGAIGLAGSERQGRAITGQAQIASELSNFSQANANRLRQAMSPIDRFSCWIIIPITVAGTLVAVKSFFIADSSELENEEWKRLLTLAGGLYSLGLSVRSITDKKSFDFPSGAASMELRNQLNNLLSAIVGQAELGGAASDVTDSARAQFSKIAEEAQEAATVIKTAVDPSESVEVPATHKQLTETVDPKERLEAVIDSYQISDNLYMLGGSACDVELRLEDVGRCTIAGDSLERLLKHALAKFGHVIDDESILTICSYRHDNYGYIDLVRRRRNSNVPDRVVLYGDYESIDEASRSFGAGSFIDSIDESNCLVAIDKRSSLPVYLSFRFSLSTADADSDQQAGLRILAIDDQPVILDLFQAMGQSLGYVVVTAASGEEGVRKASESGFDIVLTDLAMPGISGLETARRIQKIRPGIPIILVTGWEATVGADQLKEAGISEVLYKPFRLEQLIDLIKSSVDVRSLA